MGTTYEQDVVAWANEQAALLRAGKLSIIDAEHIAEEIEGVRRSEQRALASRMTALLVHLLKWEFQPALRGKSWQRTIAIQRKDIAYDLRKMPSLKTCLTDEEWLDLVWAKAITVASNETGLEIFPESCTWTMEQALDLEFFPEERTC